MTTWSWLVYGEERGGVHLLLGDRMELETVVLFSQGPQNVMTLFPMPHNNG